MIRKKQLIFNADDFGISNNTNQAIFEGFKDGLLTSTSIMTNAPAFDNAIELLPKMNDIGFGVHLNIMEFQSIQKKINGKSLLYDKNGCFNNSYPELIIKSFNTSFMEELEEEFRIQIETAKNYKELDHIDSHVHIHAIPLIFNLVCKLAKEYNIPYIRTQLEIPYMVSDIKKYLYSKYYLNWIKLLLLGSFSAINKISLNKYNLQTNNFFLGINYTGFMDKITVESGIRSLGMFESAEIIVHPSTNPAEKTLYTEYQTVIDKNLMETIQKMDIKLVSYKTTQL